VVRHEERVDGDAVAKVVAATEAFALEAEPFIELDRRFVPREHVQLQLADPGLPGPVDGGFEQGASDSPAPMTRRDHHAEVGDVGARRMRVARERQATDDAIAVGRHQHSRIGVAADRLEVAAFVCDRTPPLGGQQPVAGLLADGGRERDQLRCVVRIGGPHDDHRTTTP
jgi:hypothetical protein